MVKKEDIVAIIPARGGSKRIPLKNIVDFYGKPLIAWTIEAAQKSDLFDTIIVSTDSDEIAKISQKYKASVPFMRDKYTDDFSDVSQVTIYSLEKIKNILGKEYKIVIQLMPNCPLRTSSDIINSLQNFCNKKAKLQISCFEFGWMNPWWAFKLTKNNTAEYLFPNAIKMRSQDLEKLYCPTGSIWIADIKTLELHNSFYSKDTIFFPINWKSAFDIDDYDDLEMAKATFNLFKIKQQAF